MTKLLVMSVYGKNSAKWLDIQHDALQRTTRDYEHAIYLNNIDISHDNMRVIGKSITDLPDTQQHYCGLLQLIEYAKCRDDRAWLILDCDCFPINQNWEAILGNKNASIIRTENLDTFNHPSAVYCVDRSLKFKISEHTNLAGHKFDELAAYGKFFPLLRSNKINYHPLKYGIYYDLFYHHCAGSREFVSRSDQYYGTRYPNLDSEFFADPYGFIRPLVNNIHDKH